MNTEELRESIIRFCSFLHCKQNFYSFNNRCVINGCVIKRCFLFTHSKIRPFVQILPYLGNAKLCIDFLLNLGYTKFSKAKAEPAKPVVGLQKLLYIAIQ